MKTMKRPISISLLLTLLIISFPVVSGVLITILKLNQVQARLVQTLSFLFAGILGCIIAKKMFGALGEVGLRQNKSLAFQDYLWFIPILVIEVIPFLYGFNKDLQFHRVLLFFVFALAVGFAEELYFRGMIAHALRTKGLVLAILLSSALFSLGHIFNLLSGAALIDTVLQVLFALLFGIVAVLIGFSTGSLLIPILWHILHNFIALITATNQGAASNIAGGIQAIILLLYAVFLWTKFVGVLKEEKSL